MKHSLINHLNKIIDVCSSEIKTVMSNLGVHFTDDEIQEMMIEVDPFLLKNFLNDTN